MLPSLILGHPIIGANFLGLLVLPFPLAIAIAIMRHHLFDIDVILNRALVYGTLTASTIGIYIFIVGYIGSLFQYQDRSILAFLSTGFVAVIFQPLRERLQRGVNRLMYGERDDPYAVLSRLGQRLEATLAPESVLPTIVETVAQTLKLPCAAIALKDGDGFKIVAVSPVQPLATVSPTRDTGEAGEVIPLTYQGEVVGQFIFSSRGPGESFTAAERRLLEDIAHQAGVAAHAVRLTADLQRSRERLVTAREEERRRLRRDLHDGLGPHLASQSFKLEAARDSIRNNPDHAESLLNDLIGKTQNTISDVRRLVYALRPPALDELGLIAAVREHAAQCELNGVRITVAAPDHLPALPAAVEVATYRIVQEALTNVVRHARAQTCAVSIELKKGALSLQISDDGVGLSRDHHRGVGLNSMRERAEELGGRCVVENGKNGGAQVTAQLPLITDH
jgi:signal transduction histidine kinase